MCEECPECGEEMEVEADIFSIGNRDDIDEGQFDEVLDDRMDLREWLLAEADPESPTAETALEEQITKFLDTIQVNKPNFYPVGVVRRE